MRPGERLVSPVVPGRAGCRSENRPAARSPRISAARFRGVPVAVVRRRKPKPAESGASAAVIRCGKQVFRTAKVIKNDQIRFKSLFCSGLSYIFAEILKNEVSMTNQQNNVNPFVPSGSTPDHETHFFYTKPVHSNLIRCVGYRPAHFFCAPGAGVRMNRLPAGGKDRKQ